ncbi:hypothetical protein B0H16DRAFT_1517637 [Mycena metata]|uniref:DUF6535 domain-containing protein n=1 Tax=Mycena metata TaxID=1033252 RepID=A0AAD7NPS4_9AGAR|nr:hypothetical protein B0H16DRAFT_1517637 [Mycena metata]
MYYQAAGSRGTIEERGRERQRKLNGLVKWKFEVVLQAFPLLLQLALLLFASSISLYLWTVQHSVAILVTFLTALGLSSYIVLLVSATIFSDCPFQTPLGPLLRQVPGIFLNTVKRIRRTLRPVLRGLQTAISKPLGAIYRVNALRTISTKLRDTTRRFWPLVSCFGRSKLDLLPHFASQTSLSTEDPDPYAEYRFIEVSPEMAAVVWTLTTSTDPAMITIAADLGADLEWPPLDRTPETIMYRLLITAHSYMEYSSRTVRPGMTHLAVVCAKLHCALRSQLPRNLGFYRFYNLFRLKIEASNASEYAAILQIDDDGGGNRHNSVSCAKISDGGTGGYADLHKFSVLHRCHFCPGRTMADEEDGQEWFMLPPDESLFHRTSRFGSHGHGSNDKTFEHRSPDGS